MNREEFNNWLEEQKLESAYRKDYIIKGVDVGEGWLLLIKELIEKLIAAGWDKQVTQIKEKFGGLRFYIGAGTNEIFDIIEEYEEKSESICEVCGSPGKPRSGGWIKTLCDLHYKKD